MADLTYNVVAQQLATISTLHVSDKIIVDMQTLLLKSLSFDKFSLSSFPETIIKRTIESCWSDVVGITREIEKLHAIKMISIKPLEGNVVEIWEKIFSSLRPNLWPTHNDEQDDDTDDEVDESKYEGFFESPMPRWHESYKGIYIEGTALVRLLGADRERWRFEMSRFKLFDNEEQIRDFLTTYIPGATEFARIRNFVELLWLKKSWYRYSDGSRSTVDKWWYVRMSLPEGSKAWALSFTDARAELVRFDISRAIPAIRWELNELPF